MSLLSDLERDRNDLKRQIKTAKDDMDEVRLRLESLQKRYAEIGNRISGLSPSKLHVTDHAILRYAERFYDFPMEKIKSEIENKLGEFDSVGKVQAYGFVIKGKSVVSYVKR